MQGHGTEPELSVFWYTGYRCFGYNATLNDEDVCRSRGGKLLGIGMRHKIVWEKLKYDFKDNPAYNHILKHDYDYYTRGRVVYNRNKNEWIVYSSSWIDTNKKCREVIKRFCNLPDNCRFVSDPSYACDLESLQEWKHVDENGFLIEEG